MRSRALLVVTILFVVGSLIFSACSPLAAKTPVSNADNTAMDDWLGPYAPERLWGNPREAINSDGWSFTYSKALTTPYKTGEDGIASLTDKEMNAVLTWAFYTPGEPYLTERLYGLDNTQGEFGETIKEDRVFRENTPTHSYMRYEYGYPYQAELSKTTIEYAKMDGRSVVARLTIEGLGDASTLYIVPEVIARNGGTVERKDNTTYLIRFDSGVMAVVAGTDPAGWQMTQNVYPDRAAINSAMVNNYALTNNGSGDKAAWQYDVAVSKGSSQVLLFGIGYASSADLALKRAQAALKSADDTLISRKSEASSLYRYDVTAHQDVYQAALMDLLWNKMYYQYDGSYQPTFKGKVNVSDVILVPDKWEFPWPATWDSCFEAKVATLADVRLAEHDLSLYLSADWQLPTGHVPNTEWDLLTETPPLFAWAVWQVYQSNGDKAWMESVFPALESHYAYFSKAFARDHDHLFNGGFMGMDNIPRPGGSDVEQADASGWMALFASDMRSIASELGEADRVDYYTGEYQAISDAINAQLWDEATGFYYDRNAKGLLLQKSYSGLIPFIAGVSSPVQSAQIMVALKDPNLFWSDYGIRSLPADDPLYESGYSVSGWKNSNWRGPVWLPINYLLVQCIDQIDLAMGNQLRENLINNVEKNWQQTGRFYEYYDGETGAGIGADHQTGWTALVANLIYEKYHK